MGQYILYIVIYDYVYFNQRRLKLGDRRFGLQKRESGRIQGATWRIVKIKSTSKKSKKFAMIYNKSSNK